MVEIKTSQTRTKAKQSNQGWKDCRERRTLQDFCHKNCVQANQQAGSLGNSMAIFSLGCAEKRTLKQDKLLGVQIYP